MTAPSTRALAEHIAALAGPGEQIEAYVGRNTSTSVRAFNGGVESFTQATSAGVGIRVIVDGRQGFASAGSFDDDVVAATLHDARDNARFGQTDPCVALAEPDGVAAVPLDLWREDTVALDPAAKIELALELERRVVACDPRITGVRVAMYGDSAGERAIATSTGIRAWGRATFCSLSVTALARDGEAATAGSGVSLARSPDGLDLAAAAADAARRATQMLGATQPRSARLAMVLEPRLAATILGVLGGTLSGEAVLKGRSPFADRLGDTIASPLLTLSEDPTDPRSSGADEHDGEGLACRPLPLVRNGELVAFLHNTYTARRAGTRSTASAVRGARSTPGVGASALVMAPGSRTRAELIAGVDHGILVQSMSGLHSGVNAVSGDFSVGVEGIMIRGGELAEPVREATVASTIPRLLTHISAVGADREWQPGGYAATSIVIDDVTLGGR